MNVPITSDLDGYRLFWRELFLAYCAFWLTLTTVFGVYLYILKRYL